MNNFPKPQDIELENQPKHNIEGFDAIYSTTPSIDTGKQMYQKARESYKKSSAIGQRSDKKPNQTFKEMDDIDRLGSWGNHEQYAGQYVNPSERSLFTMIGDPVDITSGVFYIDTIDYALNSLFPFDLRRIYYGHKMALGNLGHGWHFGIIPELKIVDMGTIIQARDKDGSTYKYRSHDGVNWDFLPKDNLEVTYSPSEQESFRNGVLESCIQKIGSDLIWHAPDGSVRIFESEGTDDFIIKTWSDSSGHVALYEYDSEVSAHRRVSCIRNEHGDCLFVSYDSSGKITAITLRDKLLVEYTYYSFEDLKSVKASSGAIVDPNV